ncbi:transmembrane protein 8B-like [Daphnia pulicaria]|uniref:transmembrane protein 8B-like n=1 Tax=Daphnia pulicaria TaxID=35523 RepID=UPI001EEAD6EA|nr:transmembrane protein 8B-like [Daphnia pulicaria]XP_046643982.1 transmembrane protein 8B-like [Daphnia pulicaria]
MTVLPTSYWILMFPCLFVLAGQLLFVNSDVIQEFLPRGVSAYGDGLENGQLLHIPLGDVNQSLLFTYFANVTKGCTWTNVTLFLRHDGLPIVNVFNASYPNFTWVYQPIDYEENFLSDGLQQRLTIHPRQPSSSVIFGVVFFLEDAARIQQQGLTKSCTTLFWGRVETLPINVSSISVSDRVDETAAKLVRKNYVQPLSAKWVLDHSKGDDNISANTESILDLKSSDIPTFLSWSILSPTDIGGTLQVDIKFNQDERNSSVFGYLAFGTPENPNRTQFSANSSKVIPKATVIVPYPLAGVWYLSLFANCTEWNESDCQRNISVKVQISLSPCKEGACGPHGRCIQYFSAGLIYSACVCSSGFAGWSCSDGSNALSTAILLTSVLLLTLSNLFFIPAIFLAFRRGFYSQCLLYFVTMFFSSFYHACDQPEFNFCLMPYTVLQFGDFYSALTSVWLTAFIVANPSVSEEISSAMCIGGAVGIAMAVHYNPTSLASFTIPIVCGLGLIAICWTRQSCQMHKCYPGKSYCLKAVLPCLLFSIVGLVCFAFLETEDNYFYVHSIWHISIALAIVFVIPPEGKKFDITKPPSIDHEPLSL